MKLPIDAGDNVTTLRERLAEATETLEAIRRGDVDALIVQVGGGEEVYTRVTPDEPYRDLVEQMHDGAVVLAVTGEILYCNARFASLLGVPLESVIGTRFDRFVDTPDVLCIEDLLRAGRGRCRCQLIRPDGETIESYVSLTTTHVKDVDRLNVIVTDLRALHEAYRSRDLAEQNSRMKDEFLTMLAHELRNPLGAISSAVQVLVSVKGGGESGTRARNVVARQVAHLSHLVDGLLDVEQVLSGEIQLNRRPFDMAEAVRLSVTNVPRDIGLDLQAEVGAEPVWIDADVVRIEQVLTHLVANSIRHTPPGGRIHVTLRGDGHDAVLTIKDTGVGISRDLLPVVFDMFVQAAQDLDRAKGGLGIGLTLVRRLVELHGGTVVASSDGEGHGSTFTVRLPQSPTGPAPSARPDDAHPRRVLLIEDDNDARGMLRLMLEIAGHTVYDARDGVRGIELLEAKHPDVAIIDIGLPGLNGYQVAQRVRALPNGRAVVLVALTGYGRPSDQRRSTEAGFDYHLVKPVDPDALRSLLQTAARPVQAL